MEIGDVQDEVTTFEGVGKRVSPKIRVFTSSLISQSQCNHYGFPSSPHFFNVQCPPSLRIPFTALCLLSTLLFHCNLIHSVNNRPMAQL